MMKEARGRLYQDSEFEFKAFNGLKLEQLIVLEDCISEEAILVYLKVENNNWHQYFLDAGIGFWESWDELIDFEDEDDETKYIDSTDRYGVRGKEISKIYCTKNLNNSRIVIEFSDAEKLILKYTDSEDFDSACELIKIT